MRTSRAKDRRAGFTLLDLLIGVMLLLILVGGLTQSLAGMSRNATYASLDGELQSQAERALRMIIAGLRVSGFATMGGDAYPHLFLDGDAQMAYAANAHAPATHTAGSGDADFGPSREIVFLQPADADQDNRPDIDGNGRLVWSPSQFSYVLVTRADGVNVLQRRIDGLAPREVAQHVERVAFDDNTTSMNQVPLDAIRVRIWFRKLDDQGALHRYFTEAVVKLRNG